MERQNDAMIGLLQIYLLSLQASELHSMYSLIWLAVALLILLVLLCCARLALPTDQSTSVS